MTFMRVKLSNQKIYYNNLQIKTDNTISQWNLLLNFVPKSFNPICHTTGNTLSHLHVAVFVILLTIPSSNPAIIKSNPINSNDAHPGTPQTLLKDSCKSWNERNKQYNMQLPGPLLNPSSNNNKKIHPPPQKKFFYFNKFKFLAQRLNNFFSQKKAFLIFQGMKLFLKTYFQKKEKIELEKFFKKHPKQISGNGTFQLQDKKFFIFREM